MAAMVPGIHLVSEARCEAHGPKHAQLVFGQAPARFADRPDSMRLEIASPAHIVETSADIAYISNPLIVKSAAARLREDDLC